MRTLSAILPTMLFLAILVAGCRDFSLPTEAEPGERMDDSITAEAGDAFQLPFGQTARLAELGMSVEFLEVTSDSRCTPVTSCTVPGDARIMIEVRRDSGSKTRFVLSIPGVLDSYYYFGNVVQSGSDSIRLLRLEPYPQPDTETDPDAYLAFLRVDTL